MPGPSCFQRLDGLQVHGRFVRTPGTSAASRDASASSKTIP